MPDEPKLMLFIAASAVLILTPGPAVLYIIARSVGQGRGAGLVSAAGVGLGNLAHAITAALGMSAILTSSTFAYAFVHYAGAAYLLYLGVKKLFFESTEAADPMFSAETLGATFRQAVVVAVLNPKTALFFVAFLPQFAADDGGPLWAQLLVLGCLFVAMAMVSDAGYALLSGALGSWIRGHKGFLAAGRTLSGVVYCALGILAAITRAPDALP